MTIRRLDGTSPWRDVSGTGNTSASTVDTRPSSLASAGQGGDVFGPAPVQRNVVIDPNQARSMESAVTPSGREPRLETLSLLDWTF